MKRTKEKTKKTAKSANNKRFANNARKYIECGVGGGGTPAKKGMVHLAFFSKK